MKKLFLGLAVFVFAASFFAARWLDMRKSAPEEIEEAALAAAPYPLKLRSFTLVIVGRNNGASVEKTLHSVFSQVYDNYRLVYIEDCSDEGSFEVARDAIYASEYLTQVTLVHNEEKLGLLANIYRAVKACPDDEIVVILDGEDFLAHEWVLQRLNAYYEDPNIWITLAQGIDYPSYQLAPMCEIKEGRQLQRLQFHLKSFYAALFKKVRDTDFVYGGTFLPVSAELAYMAPMLEMGKDHYQFIS
ncbi:MAG: glycosyltransferase family 2 protein, partial [Verrucomicrobiota bacterium]|nr:glycosyltransferase family 2 protein [Verrucomicrobiota bacterium]